MLLYNSKSNKLSITMKKNYLILSVLIITFFICCKYNNDVVNNLPAKEQWSKTYDGSDFTVPQYPDLYSHYWDYVWSVKDYPNMALRIHGAFPHCRYFSFSLYDDLDGSAINGMSDYEIVPDDGSGNPFVVTSDKENYYTIYIVPPSATEAQIRALNSKNLIRLKERVDNANIMIRQYLGKDEYGGVDMPAIEAIDLTTMKEIPAPISLEGNVDDNVPPYEAKYFESYDDVPFMLAPHGSYYPNNATDYLYARTAIEDNQVLTFSFIPVPMPQSVEDYSTEHARYWSICLGSCMDTRSYYSINFDQAKVPESNKVTFVIVTKQNPAISEIEKRVKEKNEEGDNWQIIEWDRTILSFNGRTKKNDETIGNVITIMYRNILPDKKWEYSISQMEPTPYGDSYKIAYEDPNHKIASVVLGDYGPHGTKYKNEEFLNKFGRK